MVGISARHGEHHDAQTFTTPTLPIEYLNSFPESVIPARAGALTRFGGVINVTEPLPETKLSCGFEDPPPHPEVVSTKRREIVRESLRTISSFSLEAGALQVRYM